MTTSPTMSQVAAAGPTLADRRVPTSDLLGWGFLSLSLAVWALALVAGLQAAIFAFTLIGLIATMVGLISPPIGLFGIGILCTTDTLARFGIMTGGILRYNTFNYWLSLVVLLYAPFLLRLRNATCIIWQLFVVLLTIQLMFSPDLFHGILQVLFVLSPLGLLVYFTRTCRDERLWYWLGVVCGTIGAAGGAVVLATDTSLIQLHGNQYTFFPISAIFAICLGFTYATRHRRGQIMLLLLAALNLGWVLSTGSRGGLLIAGCAMTYLLLKLRGTSRRLAVFAMISLMVLIAVILSPDLIGHTLERMALLFDSDHSMRMRTSGRWELTLGGWYIFLDHPFGVGTGGYEHAWRHLDVAGALSGFKAGEKTFAHAAWVKTLSENGVFGLLLHIAFVFSFAVAGYRERHRGLFGLGLLVTVTLCIVYTVHEFAPRGPWMLVAGTLVMLQREDVIAALYRALGRQPPTDPHAMSVDFARHDDC